MKKTFIIAFLIVGLVGIGSFVLFSGHEGFVISVKNQTNRDISDLYLTYYQITSDIKIPSIPAGKAHELTVTPTGDFIENSMELYYKDQKGQLHTVTVIGYFENGYNGEATITIKSIDENGKMDIVVKQEI